jgi:FkbM family methyltransferase
MESEYFQQLINDGDEANYCITNELLLNKPKAVCFDIGAFHGVWGEGILRRVRKPLIFFFEPNPENFKILNERFGNLPHALLFNLAISDSNGTLDFAIQGPTSNSRTDSTNTSNNTKVPCVKIDEFFQKIPYVDIVKIDTEGHDMNVLNTLLPFIREKRVGAVVTEFTTYWYGTTFEEVFEATSVLCNYFECFAYCYALSRNGPPFVVRITMENMTEFIGERHKNHIQSDLYFTNKEITSIPVFPFKSGTYYI